MPLAPPPSLKQFDEWSEDSFATLGSGTGTAINPPRRDRRGWDFLVEWDVQPVAGLPSDRQRLGRTARVQVKSSRQPRPTAKLKLSNAKRFAEAVDPCFIVLFWLNKAKTGVEIYARHFDEELVARTLKRVREADRDGRTDLNRIEVLFPMREEDLHTDDLLAWMTGLCAGDPNLYASEKAAVAERVGYEDGGIVGSIKIPLSGVPALIEHAIGLQPSFDPAWIELRDARFGIPAREPIVSGKPFSVDIKVKPQPAVVSVASDNGEEVTFPGEFRSFALPGYDPNALWASFTSPNLVGRLYGSRALQLDYDLKGADLVPARHLHKLATMFRFLCTGATSMALRIGEDVLETTPVERREQDLDQSFFVWVEQMLAILLSVARPADHPRLSLAAMVEAGDGLFRFASCVAEGSSTLTATFDAGEGLPVVPRCLMGYAHIALGDSVYGAVYRQPALREEVDGDKLVVEFGDPILLDHWARKGALATHLPALRRRFKECVGKARGGVVTLNGGDMIAAAIAARSLEVTSGPAGER